MSVDSKTFLKLAWVLASVSCFIFPLLLLPFDGLHSWTRLILGDMGFGMLVLSLPLGLVYLLAVACFVYMFSLNEFPVTFYVLLWFGFFVTGYLQWFHLLPHLLNKQNRHHKHGFTTLGLEQDEEASVSSKRHRPRRRHKPAPAQLNDKQVARFEELRRTPLERVIGES